MGHLLWRYKDRNACFGVRRRVTMVLLYWMLMVMGLVGRVVVARRYEDQEREEELFDRYAEKKFPYESIRLPGDVIPVEYGVFLHPNITNGKFGVTGEARILLEVKKETHSIILHSKSLTHIYTGVYEYGLHGRKIPIRETLTHEKHELVMIQLGEKLSTNKRYVLRIIFEGTLSTGLRGFYRSSYKNENGVKKYIATSHFEATGARLAFPCFDEPAMKAKFTIVMVREKIHTALSNMPVARSVVREDGLIEDHFQKSVKMSTYLVAFIVSDFASLSTTSTRNVKIRVWAPKHLISQAKYAIEVTPKILDYYEKFFKVDFPLPKQDLIAIPDFSAGAMENWGLITYRLTALLYDEKESSSANKQRVVEVIAHELAHQWFGNLVTMKWWNDLWLNEGFARFVQFIGTNVTSTSWRLMDQFVNDNVHRALALDSKLNSHPISVPVSDPADIGGLFDGISYSKGGSIIRMMRDFIGPEIFRNGLAAYLEKYKYKNAVSDDLWASLSKATNNKVNVKKIMDTWTLQMGYPVVNVFRDPNNKEAAIITQERFVTDVEKSGTKNSLFKWEIPLTYYFQRNQQKQTNWLHLEDKSIKITWPQQEGWMKVNVDQIGFYRVNYDKQNWKALANQLKTDHMKLSDADRSNLLDDAFALANAGRLNHSQALDLTEYLVKEKHYVPFYSGMSSLSQMGKLLLNLPAYAYYEKYVIRQISPLVHEVRWEDKGTHLKRFLRSLVLRSAVSHNKADAVKDAKKMYNDWMVNGKSIPANLRSAVYLAGIKYGGQKEWNYMLAKYKASIYPSEKSTLMYALTETSDPNILGWYLRNSVNNNVIRSQDTCSLISKIASNPIGSRMARNFVKSNWDSLFKKYGHGTGITRLISGVFSDGKTKAELTEAVDFLHTHKLGSGKLYAKRSLASIRNNINWLEKNEKNVEKWLKNKMSN